MTESEIVILVLLAVVLTIEGVMSCVQEKHARQMRGKRKDDEHE